MKLFRNTFQLKVSFSVFICFTQIYRNSITIFTIKIMWVNDLRSLQKLFCRKSINIFSFPCPMLQHNNSFRLFCQIYLGVIAIVIYLYSTLSSTFLLPSFNKEFQCNKHFDNIHSSQYECMFILYYYVYEQIVIEKKYKIVLLQFLYT